MLAESLSPYENCCLYFGIVGVLYTSIHYMTPDLVLIKNGLLINPENYFEK